MHNYWEVTLEAIKHTAMVLPLLFIVYYLIELFEYKCASKIQNNKLLKGKASPVIGAVVGCVPQCGFSVISADLFSKKIISVGALIAVFIATSDEAIPLMFANPKSIPWMLLLIGVKIIVGISIGYLSMLLYKIIFGKNKHNKNEHSHHEEHNQKHNEEDHHNNGDVTVHGGCCNHNVEGKSFDWVHPLTHSLKIGLFILIINILFGYITHIWVGEEKLAIFLNNTFWLQPLLAVVIGLIPNCVSSVVLTELFLNGLTSAGGLSFGALVAGLCVNAGLGLIMLLKTNKSWKENLFVIATILVSSLLVGYALSCISLI